LTIVLQDGSKIINVLLLLPWQRIPITTKQHVMVWFRKHIQT